MPSHLNGRGVHVHSPPDFPSQAGTYLLIFELETPVTVTLKRFGVVNLAAGLLVYVGSAHGSGGLRARVGRHLRPNKRPHWHIDGLTALLPVSEVWFSTSEERLECEWSAAIRSAQGVSQPIPGFGSSDCSCLTHLYHAPSLSSASNALAVESIRL